MTKIALCGNPHSGKSVFLVYLKKEAEQRGIDYMLLRCAPDGEGTWSQESQQELVEKIREKGSFSENWVNFCIASIRNTKINLNFIDLGGKRSEENKQILKECNFAVIISSSEVEEWEEYLKSIPVEVIAKFYSSLEGKDKLYQFEPVFIAKITNLIRGKEVKKPIISLFFDFLETKFNLKQKGGEIMEFERQDVVYVEIPQPVSGIFKPEDLKKLIKNLPPSGGNKGIILSGRAPIWVYGYLVHYYHPRPFVATFDPRINGAVVVATHITDIEEGEIIKVKD